MLEPLSYLVRRLGLSICSSTSHSHSHTLTITYTCCYDEIKRTQDLKLYSHAHSLILSLAACSGRPCVCLLCELLLYLPSSFYCVSLCHHLYQPSVSLCHHLYQPSVSQPRDTLLLSDPTACLNPVHHQAEELAIALDSKISRAVETQVHTTPFMRSLLISNCIL